MASSVLLNDGMTLPQAGRGAKADRNRLIL